MRGRRPGENVAILEGDIDSGGSAANWSSHAGAGTVALLRDVPLSYLQALRSTEGIEIVSEPAPGREQAERADARSRHQLPRITWIKQNISLVPGATIPEKVVALGLKPKTKGGTRSRELKYLY